MPTLYLITRTQLGCSGCPIVAASMSRQPWAIKTLNSFAQPGNLARPQNSISSWYYVAVIPKNIMRTNYLTIPVMEDD